MSIAIPTLIEKDIRCGKARYETYQTGMGGQSVLVVPDQSYIIIFGYDFGQSEKLGVVMLNTSNSE